MKLIGIGANVQLTDDDPSVNPKLPSDLAGPSLGGAVLFGFHSLCGLDHVFNALLIKTIMRSHEVGRLWVMLRGGMTLSARLENRGQPHDAIDLIGILLLKATTNNLCFGQISGHDQIENAVRKVVQFCRTRLENCWR